MTRRRTKWIVGAVAAAALAGGGGVAAAASGNSPSADGDTPITGQDLQRATEAALAHTGGGEVTGTEVDDEEGAFEVEVTLADGDVTDVHLDQDFTVLSTETENGEQDDATENESEDGESEDGESEDGESEDGESEDGESEDGDVEQDDDGAAAGS
ncbi:hypothetical protein [Streptomyces radicis]|uniref:PepSY domain-containing protein n=1 Tax=Streptomyces radicis TaxID=1750517 RepID=UPI001C7DDDAF|nr:hypothetical protein [Streptomyces radicis]